MSEPPHEGPPLPFPRRPLIELLPAPGEPPPRQQARPRYGLALLLFALTLFCTTTLGPMMYYQVRTDMPMVSETDIFLLPRTVAKVWGDPELLAIGLSFSIPIMTILLAHELGHYIACRRYGLPCTVPYFLPVPLNFGTLGAFIRIRAPIRSKRELFDVGVAGPIAGFVALIPFLLYGVAQSEIVSLSGTGVAEPNAGVLALGRCLAFEIAVRVFHGGLGEGMHLNLHPAAMAAWLGLFATSLNLLPLGQLDGGHVLYAATGPLQRRLALPLWIALGLMGFLWLGWILWCAVILLIGLYHPPVWDEKTPLDSRRRTIAWLALLLLALSFTPVPISILPIS